MIFEFQRQIDIPSSIDISPEINNNNNNHNNNNNKSLSKNKKTSSDDATTFFNNRDDDEIKVMKKYFPPKLRKTKSAHDISAQHPSIWHTATPWQYNAPKPIRPQLHAFF